MDSANLRRALRDRAPLVHRHLSRAYALGLWSFRRWSGGDDRQDEYGGDFWQFHDTGDWAGFAALLLDTFAPARVGDVGCGDGKLLAAIAARAPAVAVTGYDGSRAALDRARSRGLTVELVDLASLGRTAPAALADRLAACDLVTCLETAEHLPPWSARGLVRLLARAPVVVFSAAQPGQGGTMHLNERPPDFWRTLFAGQGLEPHPLEARVREDVQRLDLPWWYGANLQVFRRR
jgi:SAM-dependent methyltransferase